MKYRLFIYPWLPLIKQDPKKQKCCSAEFLRSASSSSAAHLVPFVKDKANGCAQQPH